jgi:recombination endonuclease VII
MADGDITFICCHCGVSKPDSGFYKYSRNGRARQRHPRCKECYKVYRPARTRQIGRGLHALTDIDPIEKKGTCACCGLVDIVLVKSGQSRIWRCQIVRAAQRGKRSISGIFRRLMGAACEICGSRDNLCADHDHLTQQFRGTLCRACNFGIGWLGDSIEGARNAVRYFESRC